ncbi:MAG: ABC transporter substrate-binding protein [archaeon]
MNKTIIVIGIIIILAGCANQVAKKELTPVKVQLKWLHQAQFAGIYAAAEKGFYEKYGINVEELNEFNFNDFPVDLVESKKADFAVAGADELILAKSKGEAEHVKAIAVIYKINPVCLYTLKESGIKNPTDFIGKTIGIEKASNGADVNVGFLYYAMMKNLGIDRNKIHEVAIGFDATELLSGKTDVSSGYIINEPNFAIEAGKEVVTILPADYGINMYADVIITHTDTLEERPELVEGFLRATLEGWQYAIENEEETVDIVMKYAKDTTHLHQELMLRSSLPLINTGESPLGMMESKEWEGAQRIFFSQEILPKPVGPENIYTTEVLEKIYGNKDNKNKTTVNVKLLWLHQNQFAGFYAADKQGYYNEKGLDVRIHSSGYGLPVEEDVENGNNEFGIVHGPEFAKAVAKGSKIKAIAAIYSHDPVVFISLSNKNIKAPPDLKGKTIAFSLSTPERVNIAVKKAGILPSEVTYVQKKYGIHSLNDDATDVLVGLSINEYQTALEENLNVSVLTSSQLGIDYYSNVIFTTSDLIEKNPKLVKNFLKATLDGWKYASNNPELSSNFVFDYDTGLNTISQKIMLEKSLEYIDTDNLGKMDDSSWQRLIDDLNSIGALDRKIIPGDLYTNEFIN